MTKIVDILEELRTELVTAFAAVTDIDGWQIETRRIINPTPPCIDMYPGEPSRTNDGAGFGDDAGTIIFTLRARVGTADQDAGQDLLLALMDEEDDLSVVNALQADQTSNGTTASVMVEGPFGQTLYQDPGGQGSLLGLDWRVTILR